MDENESKNQEEQLISDAELAEIQASISSTEDVDTEPLKLQEVKFRHPQQILTNKEIQILFEKKGKLDELNAEREKNGEEPLDTLTDTEQGAIKLFLVRAKHHGSTPKKVLSTKQNKVRKVRKRLAKASRKNNR